MAAITADLKFGLLSLSSHLHHHVRLSLQPGELSLCEQPEEVSA